MVIEIDGEEFDRKVTIVFYAKNFDTESIIGDIENLLDDLETPFDEAEEEKI